MKLTHFGGATAILEHQGKRILFDPWLDDGIFHGSWYHYPPLKVGIEDVGRVDYIYISHIHEDHCSPGTIQYLNRDAQILLMDRHLNFVARFLSTYGFEFKSIHLIQARTPKEIEPGLWVDMLEADPENELNHIIDSSIILKWDEFVIYNANDCPPYTDGLQYVKRQYGTIDLALLPYTGGSGYPACYTNLSHQEKLHEKQRIANHGVQTFVDAVKMLRPRYAMPFADQYVIAGSRSHLNEYLPHPPEGSVVAEALAEIDLARTVLLLNSGQTFDLVLGNKIPDEPYHFFSEADRSHYINAHLRDKTYDHEKIELGNDVSLTRLLSQARSRLLKAQKSQEFFPAFSYYLDVPDRNCRFHIDLTKEEVHQISLQSNLQEPYLRITASSTLVAFLLIGHISWNIADAALFLDYERQPNTYDPKVHVMVNYLKI